MFKKGELDAASLTLAEYWYDKLPDDDPLVEKGLVKKAVFCNQLPRPPYAMWINRDKPLLNERNIRLGIQYASNWQLVIDSTFAGTISSTILLLVTARSRIPESRQGNSRRTRLFEYFAKADSRSGPDGILVNDAGGNYRFL